MSPSSQQQKSLTNFFGTGSVKKSHKRPRSTVFLASSDGKPNRRRAFSIFHNVSENVGSRFGTCPLCDSDIPWHRLENHAATCTGKKKPDHSSAPTTSKLQRIPPSKQITSTCTNVIQQDWSKQPQHGQSTDKPQLSTLPHPLIPVPRSKTEFSTTSGDYSSVSSDNQDLPPGLYWFPDFITPDDERQLLEFLDTDICPPWKLGRFNGQHSGKRWGVHCNLRDRRVDAPTHDLPHLLQTMVLSKLSQLPCWTELANKKRRKGGTTTTHQQSSQISVLVPNEANAIDYRRSRGDWLEAHVDDRKLSTEPIANLSLAGDCYMTFRNTKKQPPLMDGKKDEYKVWLPRRSLQILTGPARYNCTHAIANADLQSDRRVSITMRESPITEKIFDDNNNSGHRTTPKIDAIFDRTKYSKV